MKKQVETTVCDRCNCQLTKKYVNIFETGEDICFRCFLKCPEGDYIYKVNTNQTEVRK